MTEPDRALAQHLFAAITARLEDAAALVAEGQAADADAAELAGRVRAAARDVAVLAAAARIAAGGDDPGGIEELEGPS